MTTTETTEAPRAVSLGEVFDNFGPSIAKIIVAPQGLDAPVGEVTIHDPADDTSLEPGAIVLAIGIQPDSAVARQVIADAGDADAAAVAFKFHGRACEWVSEAERHGVALVQVADEMSWSQLNALLTLTIPGVRSSGSVPGMASVPLGDLFSLANAIAGVVGGAITIEDPQKRVLAYSNLDGQEIDDARRMSILGRQVPDVPGVVKMYRKLWASEGPIHVTEIEGLDILPRMAVPIRVGRETLGSIWVVEGATKLGKETANALTEAGRVAAVHMIHARASRDIERRMRGDLLRSFLQGRGDVDSTASRLGIALDSPAVVIALELSTADPIEEELYRQRLVDLVAMYSDAFRLKAVWVAIGSTVYGLMPVTATMSRERVIKLTRDIHAHARTTLDVPLRTALSATVSDLRGVPVACREAERILRVLASHTEGPQMASIEDVRSRATLLVLRDLAVEHPDLLIGPVQAIAAHDSERGTHYLETLRAYLAAFGDVPTAAESANVHPNTFRYRLRRLIDVFDLDLDDPDQRLVLDLQLRLVTPPTTTREVP